MKGCTGDLVNHPEPFDHRINGTITVLDDCTFKVEGWDFDGVGPAVEWWAAKADPTVTDGKLPYATANSNAKKISEVLKPNPPKNVSPLPYVAG